MQQIYAQQIYVQKKRSLDCLSFWKGLEYQTFHYYLGIVILKDNISQEAYDHFLLLFCAVTICSSKEYCEFIELADNLIDDGIDSISSNFHNLCHLTSDVLKFGCLSEISTYPFENFLGFIKHLLRQGNLPLEQICNRLVKHSNLKMYTNSRDINPFVKYMQLREGRETFNYVNTGRGFILSNKDGDKWVLTQQNEIVEVLYIIDTTNAAFKNKNDCF